MAATISTCLMTCTASAGTTERIKNIDLSQWQQVSLGLGVSHFRKPLAAVVALGPTHFAVTHVTPDRYSNYRGNLVLHEFDLISGLKSGARILSTNSVGSVRGSLSQGLAASCPPVFKSVNKASDSLRRDARSPRALSTTQLLDSATKTDVNQAKTISGQLTLGGKANFLAFDEVVNGDETIKITRLLSCPGRALEIKTVTAGTGISPSLAIARTRAGEDKILLTYGSGGARTKLMGRFYNTLAEPIGPAFVIFDYRPDYYQWRTFSTDIIWNPSSQRFIIGLMIKERENSDIFQCSILNLLVSETGVASEAIQRGICDANGGHSTWVDIDRDPATNPDGTYAWYYESRAGKNIYIMDRLGNPTGRSTRIHGSDSVSLGREMNNAPPFAAILHPDSTGSTVPIQISDQQGPFRDQYVVALRHRPHPSAGHGVMPLLPYTFSADGNLVQRRANSVLYGDWLHGIGSLKYHTVYVHGLELSGGFGELRINVQKNEEFRQSQR